MTAIIVLGNYPDFKRKFEEMNALTLTIDGKKLQVEAGITLLEAAQREGIYIPALCADPDLKPYGACQLCTVEIEGMQDLALSCIVLAADGMVIQTNTERVKQVRRRILEIIKLDHANDCKLCPKNENCELQRACRYVGVETYSANKIAWPASLDQSSPFFNLDRRRCILCAKCVRTCQEIQGLGAIELVGYGFATKVAGVGDKAIAESTCESCGQCVDRCPTASLLDKVFRVPTEEVKTVCPYCGVGCGIYLGLYYGQISSVRGDRENLANKGSLCVKGRFGIVDFINSFERLDSPLVKRNGEFVRVSWNEALDIIATRLSGCKGTQFALISSAKSTNEDNYIAQKFARVVMGTNNVDNCARLCHSSTMTALNKSLGSGAMTNSIQEIGEAKCILAIGTNTTETHPVIGLQVRKAVRTGAKLIVANPRQIDLCRIASVWLRNRPGTDVALLSGMARVIVDEGLLDRSFVENRCENFAAFEESLKDFDLERVEQLTGVEANIIAQAARIYATSSPASILYAMGITQHSHGTDNVLALANLAMLTGNLGKCSAGINPLRGQNNVQGACDMGCLPDFYPGYQPVSVPKVKEKFEAAWGCSLIASIGLSLTEMFEAAHEGKVKAIYIIGENPIISEPNSKHVEEALRALDFLIVQDIFRTETAELADVILPATTFAEKEGTFTNTERRIQRVRKAIEPIGSSKPDWWITCQIAKGLGETGFDFSSPSEIMTEIAELTPNYGGITYSRLDNGGLQWPCPHQDHPGTSILHSEQFSKDNGKGKLFPLNYLPPVELPDEQYPLMLTTGRCLYHYHTGTMTRKISGLNQMRNGEWVEINPEDAVKYGIKEGDIIRVLSRRGRAVARVKITSSSPPGLIFMTFHFAESPANELTHSALDPEAKIPELKVSAVNIEKADEGELKTPSSGGDELDSLFDGL